MLSKGNHIHARSYQSKIAEIIFPFSMCIILATLVFGTCGWTQLDSIAKINYKFHYSKAVEWSSTLSQGVPQSDHCYLLSVKLFNPSATPLPTPGPGFKSWGPIYITVSDSAHKPLSTSLAQPWHLLTFFGNTCRFLGDIFLMAYWSEVGKNLS